MTLLSSVLIIQDSNGQAMQAGDLMCVGFNADGNDDLSFVALADIPANTNIYLRDDEWEGTAFNTGESWTLWNTGAAIIPTGSIVSFLNVNSATPTVNFGTAATTGNAGLAAGGDGVFVYLGSDQNTPTKFISAVMSNTSAALAISLMNTGLVEGSTALVLLPANLDIAAYKGPRSGSDKAGYLTLVNAVSANWVSQDGSGDQSIDGIDPDAPFSLVKFTFGGTDALPPSVTRVSILNSSNIVVTFSESVPKTSAELVSNYTFTPSLAITSIIYNDSTKSAVLVVNGLVTGRKYNSSINGLRDLANNAQTIASITNNLYFNNYSGGNLVISEIMYNPGSGGDSLEFVEIHNRSTSAIPLGGLRFSTGIIGTYPEHTLPANTAACIALDSAAFRRFYNVTAMGQWASDALSNGGERLEILNTLGEVIDSLTYDDAAPWVLEPDGSGPSLEIINSATDNALASNWRASRTATNKKYNNVDIFASPNLLPIASSLPEVAFTVTNLTIKENVSTGNLSLTIKNPNGTPTTVAVNINPIGTALPTSDYVFTNQNVTFTGDTTAANRTRTINFTVINDGQNEADEYFVLNLLAGTNSIIGSVSQTVVFINDDDQKAPVATNELSLKHISSYQNGLASNNTAEIVAYDVNSKRIFIANIIGNKIDVVDFSNPVAPRPIRSINVAPFGINSIVAKNGIIVACLEDSAVAGNGFVYFLDTAGTIIKNLRVGVLPDMIGVSPDGKMVVTANEAQPSESYLTDPEGSVSIIDVSNGVNALTQASVSTISFVPMNAHKTKYKNDGIRIFGMFKGSMDSTTVAQDLEPEYIAFSSDSKEAYVCLQENNAIAVIDLQNKALKLDNNIPIIWPLGLKDHSLVANALDASDQSADINMANWRIKGMYMPDAIDYFESDGKKYLISANEGDSRAYAGFNEETSLSAMRLDASKFPDSTFLRRNTQLGRMLFTNASGDTDGDGDFDELHAFGARSFTIWDAANGKLVWDSGDWLERITRDSTFFNASNGATAGRKARSRSKGPEPEGITVAKFGTKTFAFVGLERAGGIMVFNITNPIAPTYVTYVNNRPTDRGAEGILFIDAKDSPNGKYLILTANETSSTIATYEVTPNFNVSVKEDTQLDDIVVYPNPTSEIIYLSKSLSGQIINLNGQVVKSFDNSDKINLDNLTSGTYYIKALGFKPKAVMIIK